MKRLFAGVAGLLAGLACHLPAGAQESQPIAITGVNIIAMTGGAEDPVLSNQTVIVENGRIARLGPAGEVTAPKGARLINGEGKFLTPGLAEMHAHIPGPTSAYAPEDVLFLYVSQGVTLARGMLGHPDHLPLRDASRNPQTLSPWIYAAAPGLGGANTQDPDEARAKIVQYAAEGFDHLKVHEGLTVAVYDAITAAAKEHGLPFAGHVSDLVGLPHALDSGQRTVDHMDNFLEYVGADTAPVTDDMLRQAVEMTLKAKAGVVPTQALWETFVTPAEQLGAYPELRYAPKAVIEQWRASHKNISGGVTAEEGALLISNRRKLLKAFVDGGAEVLMGSDAPQIFSVPGFSLHHEMAAMAAAGIAPYDILYSGTAAPGAYYAEDGLSGVIAPGARADMILLSANPLDDIANMRKIEGVMLRGHWLAQADIDQRLEAIAKKYE